MDQIRPWLFIGGVRDTLNMSYLTYKSIGAMLQLAAKVEQPGISSLYLPVEDFEPLKYELLKKGISFVREQKKVGCRILVACGAGINRSSSYCTAILKEEESLPLFEAFREVKHQHPEAMPHEPIWESLCQYYNESVPYLDVMRVKV